MEHIDWQWMVAPEGFLHGIERGSADIAENNPDGTKREFWQATLDAVPFVIFFVGVRMRCRGIGAGHGRANPASLPKKLAAKKTGKTPDARP